VEGDVAVKPLVERLDPKEVGSRARGGGGALSLPEDCCRVVVAIVEGVLTNVGKVANDIVMRNGAGQFEFAVVDGPSGIGKGDQGRDHSRGKRSAPEDWPDSGGGTCGRLGDKRHTTHARASSVTGP
jgi:hypothetical protein